MTKFETNLPTVIEELQAKDIALEAKDVDLQNQIDSEIAKRISADVQLQANIDTEAVARFNADKLLQTNIDAEANSRASKDQDLQGQIDALNIAGTVQYFARKGAPEGWLKADGSVVSRTQYAKLFAAVGTMFGTGDGSTTFNLPDLRGEFVRGFDDGRGVDSGRVLGSLQKDEFKTHKHPMISWNHSTPDGANAIKVDTLFISPFVQPPSPSNPLGGAPGSSYASIPGMTITENTLPNASEGYFLQQNLYGQPGGTETHPRNVALLACIKY